MYLKSEGDFWLFSNIHCFIYETDNHIGLILLIIFSSNVNFKKWMCYLHIILNQTFLLKMGVKIIHNDGFYMARQFWLLTYYF